MLTEKKSNKTCNTFMKHSLSKRTLLGYNKNKQKCQTCNTRLKRALNMATLAKSNVNFIVINRFFTKYYQAQNQ